MASAQLHNIVRSLEEDIIFARLFPRERLVEDALMRRFEAKRHTVRQALAELERIGVVTKERHKGAMVRDYTLQEIEEIYEMRELLEERAARRIPLPAEPRLTARLRRINARLGEALEARDLRTIYRVNNELHEALFGACGNRYLARSIRYYAWQAHPIRSYRIADPERFAPALREHAQMIDALEHGDRERLARLCVEHIRPSKEAYLATRRLADPDHDEDQVLAVSRGRR